MFDPHTQEKAAFIFITVASVFKHGHFSQHSSTVYLFIVLGFDFLHPFEVPEHEKSAHVGGIPMGVSVVHPLGAQFDPGHDIGV